uniref:NADH:ubiquinone reductase (H(+)-translocating) n=1 Tax=Tremex columba TaxID=222809 RepID=A0A3G5BC63_TRECO|nr:NADH dehydrogenase subunit 5 [Tremex columba]AYV97237.1 NADH dehydrogenase subunit 5 [Tremex columba]
MGNMLFLGLGMLSMSFMFFMHYLYLKKNIFIMEYSLSNFWSIELSMIYYFDWMSMFFLSVVLFISSMVMMYIKGYMSEDKNLKKFYWLVVFFILSMLMLILSMNLFWLIVGWDTLGVFSYLLIIYYQSMASMNSGLVTILINRLGDVSLILAMVMMMKEGILDFMSKTLSFNMLILLMISSVTKSSQYPFSVWLPKAMAAPTPVSALVHSSTLVAAGVYLVIRMDGVGGNSGMLMIVMMTMLISSMMANVESDLKKIIAMSTMSQLSFMFFVIYLNKISLAYFHMLIHALFKSLMFLCAGVIIHYKSGDQDIRNMGILSKILPNIFLSLNLSVMCLCGMLFFSGYFSKDKIIECMVYSGGGIFIYLFVYFSVGMTVMYSMRVMYYSNYLMILSSSGMVYKESVSNSMEMSILSLFFFSIWSGYLYMNMYMELAYILVKSVKIFLLMNLFLFFLLYMISNIKWMKITIFLKFFGNMFFLKFLYSNFIYLYLKFGEWMWFNIDKGLMMKLIVLDLILMIKSSLKNFEMVYKSSGLMYLYYSLFLYFFII